MNSTQNYLKFKKIITYTFMSININKTLSDALRKNFINYIIDKGYKLKKTSELLYMKYENAKNIYQV